MRPGLPHQGRQFDLAARPQHNDNTNETHGGGGQAAQPDHLTQEQYRQGVMNNARA